MCVCVCVAGCCDQPDLRGHPSRHLRTKCNVLRLEFKSAAPMAPLPERHDTSSPKRPLTKTAQTNDAHRLDALVH